jgi:hypothetical protein
LRPAALIPPFTLTVKVRLTPLPRFCFAQRALAAAAILARGAADVLRLPTLAVEREELLLRRADSCLSRVSIFRRIETASSKDLSDRSIRTQ